MTSLADLHLFIMQSKAPASSLAFEEHGRKRIRLFHSGFTQYRVLERPHLRFADALSIVRKEKMKALFALLSLLCVGTMLTAQPASADHHRRYHRRRHVIVHHRTTVHTVTVHPRPLVVIHRHHYR